MMSEYYDQFHRWEPLAEFHFSLDNYEDMYDDNYVYCLCSRAFIRWVRHKYFQDPLFYKLMFVTLALSLWAMCCTWVQVCINKP